MNVRFPYFVFVIICMYLLLSIVPERQFQKLFSQLTEMPAMSDNPVLHFAKAAMLFIVIIGLFRLIRDIGKNGKNGS